MREDSPSILPNLPDVVDLPNDPDDESLPEHPNRWYATDVPKTSIRLPNTSCSNSMAPLDELPTNRLNLLIEGTSVVTSIEVQWGMCVDELKEDLLQQQLDALKDAKRDKMELWKVSAMYEST
jgi:hypothetical protein